MERGNDKHSPRQDEQLKAELSGMLGSGGGHREDYGHPMNLRDWLGEDASIYGR